MYTGGYIIAPSYFNDLATQAFSTGEISKIITGSYQYVKQVITSGKEVKFVCNSQELGDSTFLSSAVYDTITAKRYPTISFILSSIQIYFEFHENDEVICKVYNS